MSIDFIAPPTVADFMLSDSFVRIIMGPVGSGKTTGCIMELLRRAIEQQPGPDGIRRTRWAVTRQTLSQMKMTVLPDMLVWFRGISTYKVSEQLVILQFDDVYSEFYFIPLEEERDQQRLLSMQLTGAMINEAIEISTDFVSAIAGRCGRFPSKADGGPTWHGIIADTNCPVIGSEWWKLFEEHRPYDWALFHQPSGLADDAENVENLPPGYYERLAQNPSEAWVQRYVRSEYGEDPSGTAVFAKAFKRSFHTAKDLEPVKGFPLIVAQDFGRNPCALILQADSTGRLKVLDEIVSLDMGLETHVTRFLKPRIYADRFVGHVFAAVGDPSGISKGNMLEENSFDVLRRLGVPSFQATTNKLEPRLMAVETLLLQQRDGGPALVIDLDRCPNLVRAMNGAYRYGKTKAGAQKPLPEKDHPWSDLADCLQYACLVYNSGMINVIAKKIWPKARAVKPRPSALGWT
jgi:hypothetical protein